MELAKLELTQSRNPRLAEWSEKLSPGQRSRMHTYISVGLWGKVRNHLQNAAPSRHNTASRLGATPTGFLYPLAYNNTTREADASAAAVVISSDPANNFDANALRRARGPLRITPKKKKALTIPIHALSYGRSVADLPSSLAIFRIPKKGGHGEKSNVLGAKIDGKLVGLYALSQGVTVPQDEGLLPTDAELLESAAGTVLRYLQKRGAFSE